MSTALPFIVIGLATGALYGMAAVGLVVTYKTSGVFNFAHGATATIAAYAFYALRDQAHVPWLISAVVTVVGVGLIGGLVYERMARRLALAPVTLQVVGTIGLLLLVEAGFTQLYGTGSVQVASFLPTSSFRLFRAGIGWDNVIIGGISLLVTGFFYALLRVTLVGKQMRAVVDDPDLLSLFGGNPSLIRRYAWVSGSGLAALAGVLLAPLVDLNASTLTLLVVQAFGAAALGRFSNLPMTWVGGLVLGVASSLATKYIPTTSSFAGLPPSIPFIILFIVLLTYPRSAMRERRRLSATFPTQLRLSGTPAAALAVVAVVVLAVVPQLVGYHTSSWTGGLAGAVILLGLGLLVKTSGQISLCHLAFAAIGATTFAKLTGAAGVPWGFSLIIAGLAAVPVGAVLAIPAIRLSDLYLGLATLGFGLLASDMLYQSKLMFGFGVLGVSEPAPSWHLVAGDAGFYYLVLAIFVVIALAVHLLLRGRLGRLLVVMRETPTALQTSGANIATTRVVVFCISAFIAAIGGALYGVSLTSVTGTDFDPIQSLVLFAVVLVLVGGQVWAALVGGLVLFVLPTYFPSQTVANVLQGVFGIAAILVSIGVTPRPPAFVARFLRSRSPAVPMPGDRLSKDTGRKPPSARGSDEPSELRVSDLTVSFGGAPVLESVSIDAQAGQITGVIGPNGAGKTTLFNACSGLVRAQGAISVNGRDVSRRGIARRALSGLGRTFQQMELCQSLSVLENVAIGREAGYAGANPLHQLVAGRRESREVMTRAWMALRLCGLEDVAAREVATLSTGRRRLVELARVLAGQVDVLLLDEPSSGLDSRETTEFGRILRRVVDERQLAVLLVEHDMTLVGEICDELHVLDYGTVIFRGTPEAARSSTVVRDAYLGNLATV